MSFVVYFLHWTCILYGFKPWRSPPKSQASVCGLGSPFAGSSLNLCSIMIMMRKIRFLARCSPGHCLGPTLNVSSCCFLGWSGAIIAPSSMNLSGINSNGFFQYLNRKKLEWTFPWNTLRVPLRVQAAHLPQAYILCSIRAIISQTYGNV